MLAKVWGGEFKLRRLFSFPARGVVVCLSVLPYKSGLAFTASIVAGCSRVWFFAITGYHSEKRTHNVHQTYIYSIL